LGGETMPKTRLESFSDCIIAFAITLLILEIHLPDMGGSIDNGAMLKAIVSVLPNLLLYAISFVVCTVWWISHHSFIHDLLSVDRALLWLNSLFLMFIAFLPFPTGVLGHHPGQPVATAFYGMVCAITGLSFWMMRLYASQHAELMRPEIPTEERRRRVRISLLSPLLYAGGALLALLFPTLALCIFAGIPAYFAIGNLGRSSPKYVTSRGIEG